MDRFVARESSADTYYMRMKSIQIHCAAPVNQSITCTFRFMSFSRCILQRRLMEADPLCYGRVISQSKLNDHENVQFPLMKEYYTV